MTEISNKPTPDEVLASWEADPDQGRCGEFIAALYEAIRQRDALGPPLNV